MAAAASGRDNKKEEERSSSFFIRSRRKQTAQTFAFHPETRALARRPKVAETRPDSAAGNAPPSSSRSRAQKHSARTVRQIASAPENYIRSGTSMPSSFMPLRMTRRPAEPAGDAFCGFRRSPPENRMVVVVTVELLGQLVHIGADDRRREVLACGATTDGYSVRRFHEGDLFGQVIRLRRTGEVDAGFGGLCAAPSRYAHGYIG